MSACDEAPSLRISRRAAVRVLQLMIASTLVGCRDDDHDHHGHHDHRDHLARVDRSTANQPNCFAKGTRILTPAGYTPIEDICIDDEIILLGGERRKVLWIGTSNRLIAPDQPRSERYLPVCFSQGSLDGNLPIKKFYVSRDHRLYWNGMLVRASEFVDGRTVTFDCRDRPGEVDYFHILTEGPHSILFAEGVPCETLLFAPQTILKFDNFETFDGETCSNLQDAGQPFAQVFACNDSGYRARMASHLRVALARWIDRRTKADKVLQLLLAR
jgi:hypothetical protein